MCKLLLVAFIIPCFAIAQTRYIAGYEQKDHMDFSKIKINKPINFQIKGADSLTSPISDSLFNEIMNGDLLQKLLKENLGEELTLYLHVISDSVKAELNAGSGSQINVRFKKKYENGSWLRFNNTLQVYEIDSLDNRLEFYLTGQSKEILGLMCYEAKPTDSLYHRIAWISKDLPSTVSPGILLKNLSYGIVEYQDEEHEIHIVLKSLRKLTVN